MARGGVVLVQEQRDLEVKRATQAERTVYRVASLSSGLHLVRGDTPQLRQPGVEADAR
jgi:hypothetical protein